MAKKHGPNKENLEATRKVFLKIARKEFSTLGYYDSSTAKIVEESGMARGSLYYHFGDKKGLFRAVYEELVAEMCEDMRKLKAHKTDPWDSLMTTCLYCLDTLATPHARRIIVDVHTALTYGERAEILRRTVLAEYREQVQNAMDAGFFKDHDTDSLTLLIFGFLSEGGRSFEIANDIPAGRQQIGETFIRFMEKARA